MFDIGSSLRHYGLNGFHFIQTLCVSRLINVRVEVLKELITQYDLVLAGQSSYNEFLGIFYEPIYVELYVDTMPCHTHTTIGESNTKGIGE